MRRLACLPSPPPTLELPLAPTSLSFPASRPTLHVRTRPSFDCLANPPDYRLPAWALFKEPTHRHPIFFFSDNSCICRPAELAQTRQRRRKQPPLRLIARTCAEEALTAEGRPPWRARRSTLSPLTRTTVASLSVCQCCSFFFYCYCYSGYHLSFPSDRLQVPRKDSESTTPIPFLAFSAATMATLQLSRCSSRHLSWP